MSYTEVRVMKVTRCYRCHRLTPDRPARICRKCLGNQQRGGLYTANSRNPRRMMRALRRAVAEPE